MTPASGPTRQHPESAQAYGAVVDGHRAELEARPALRALYAHWAEQMAQHLANLPGPTYELGAGSAALSEHLRPRIQEYITTDLQPGPNIDEVADACAMPWGAGRVANIVALDVLHHLPVPGTFFDELDRVLRPGGRAVLLEPHVGALSYPLYKVGHHEPLSLLVDPFAPVRLREDSGGPCNEAIASLAFGLHRRRFQRRWPRLRIVELAHRDLVLYTLTGGYSRAARISPEALARWVGLEDRLLRPLGRLLALRKLVVLERTER